MLDIYFAGHTIFTISIIYLLDMIESVATFFSLWNKFAGQ